MAMRMTGFDIGSGNLKIAQWDGTSVCRAETAEMPENLVKEGGIVSYAAMADFLKETARERKLSGRDCAVILPAGQTFLRRVTLPAMTVEQLEVNLPYEFRDYLTMSKEKYFYDYAVNGMTTAPDGTPTEMDLTAAAVPRELIGEYREMFRRAGFRLRTAIPVECAYANLLRAAGCDETVETGILDLGYTASRLYIYTGARFETSRIVEVGQRHLERTVADGMGVDEHLARVYLQTGRPETLETPDTAEIYNAIALDVRKAVNFYGFSNRNSNLRDIWCCGGGARIRPLVETVGRAVEMRIHDIRQCLPLAKAPAEDLDLCAAALGAAMQ